MSPSPTIAEVLEKFRPLPMRSEHLEVIGRRHKLDVISWMQEHYILPAASSRIKGPWRLSMTPYWRPVLEWWGDSTTRLIIAIAARQMGKSTIFGGCLGHVIDVDPGPTKFVVPDESVAKKRIKKLRPGFQKSPRIMRHFRNDIRRLNIGEPTELDNMIFTLAWPSAPATLSDDAVRYILGDEVCEWAQELDDGMDPMSKLDAGTTTFESVSKQFYATTPDIVGSMTWQQVQRCQQWRFWWQCGYCGAYHVPRWHNVDMDRGSDGHFYDGRAYKRGGLARYKCPACKHAWTEHKRWAAVCGAVACPDGIVVRPDGTFSGPVESSPYKAIQIPGLLAHPTFRTVDKMAALFADAWKAKEQGKIGQYQTWRCHQEAEFWEHRQRDTNVETVRRHIDQTYHMGQVSRGVQVITVGVDVQMDHLWVAVIGFGYRWESWLIDARRLETGDTGVSENWQILRDMLVSTWPSAIDERITFNAAKAAIDSRYQRSERVVYGVCLEYPDGLVVPVLGEGRDKMRDMPHQTAKPLPGMDLKRYRLNTDAAKDQVWFALHDPERQMGSSYMHLPSDVPDHVIEQLSSEKEIVIRVGRKKELMRVWRPKEEGRANHLLDCTGYARLVAELAGVSYLRDVDLFAQMQARMNAPATRIQPNRRRENGFLDGLPTL